MRIRTQFIMTMLLYGVVLLAISASAINTNARVDRATEQEKIAESIAQGASELSYLANDYVIYRESQQLGRWQSRFASFASDVAKLQTDTPEQQALDRNLQANTQRLQEVFYSVVTAVGSQSPDQGGTIDPVLLQVSWSRLSVQSQGLVSDATRLSRLLRAQTERLRRANSIIIFSMISIFVTYFVANYLITQRRVLRGVANLQAGTAVIGSGNLDFKIEEKKNDEIGDLSPAFNRMTTNLREITASKAELEKEIAARKEAEEELITTNEKLQEKAAELEAEMEERKKAEAEVAHLATFPELNPNPIIELDVAGKLNYLNPTARALFPDFPTAGAGHPFLAEWGNLVATLRSGGKNSLTRDIKIGAAWYEQNITYVSSIQQFRIYSVDITERKKADRIKDEFIGMVSHELKTPITIIMGSIYTALSQGIPREEADELLKEAASSSESLASIVDNLLELSRAQANRLMISKETLDVAEIARSIVAKFKGRSEIHHLVVRVPEVLPAALADRVRVGRVLNNLIENAIKYSPQGGKVTVFTREKDDCLVVGVTDRGVGISSEDQARLFKPFERLENVSGISGVGLGLQVCRVLVEAHGGRIWVESKPGKGSTFFFTIPLNGEAATN